MAAASVVLALSGSTRGVAAVFVGLGGLVGESDTDGLGKIEHVGLLVPGIRVQLCLQVLSDITRSMLCTILACTQDCKFPGPYLSNSPINESLPGPSIKPKRQRLLTRIRPRLKKPKEHIRRRIQTNVPRVIINSRRSLANAAILPRLLKSNLSTLRGRNRLHARGVNRDTAFLEGRFPGRTEGPEGCACQRCQCGKARHLLQYKRKVGIRRRDETSPLGQARLYTWSSVAKT